MRSRDTGIAEQVDISEAQIGVAKVQHRRMEMKGYETGFEECRALAKQILPSAEASLLQIPILAISHALAILYTDRSMGHGRRP